MYNHQEAGPIIKDILAIDCNNKSSHKIIKSGGYEDEEIPYETMVNEFKRVLVKKGFTEDRQRPRL